jgi:protein phosphatase
MVKVFGESNLGKVRTTNEDFIYLSNEPIGILPNLYVVADGMGGHKAGEVASSLAVNSFIDYISKAKINSDKDIMNSMTKAIYHTNDVVFKMSKQHLEYLGMGTTFLACCVFDKNIYCVHIGDSRIYLISDTSIIQKSIDHTYVEELLKLGKIKFSEVKNHPQKNIITRAIGIEKNITPDVFSSSYEHYKYFLLCSDGLVNVLSDKIIFDIIQLEFDVEQKVHKLIEEANNCGGFDNISVILGRIN